MVKAKHNTPEQLSVLSTSKLAEIACSPNITLTQAEYIKNTGSKLLLERLRENNHLPSEFLADLDDLSEVTDGSYYAVVDSLLYNEGFSYKDKKVFLNKVLSTFKNNLGLKIDGFGLAEWDLFFVGTPNMTEAEYRTCIEEVTVFIQSKKLPGETELPASEYTYVNNVLKSILQHKQAVKLTDNEIDNLLAENLYRKEEARRSFIFIVNKLKKKKSRLYIKSIPAEYRRSVRQVAKERDGKLTKPEIDALVSSYILYDKRKKKAETRSF